MLQLSLLMFGNIINFIATVIIRFYNFMFYQVLYIELKLSQKI